MPSITHLLVIDRRDGPRPKVDDTGTGEREM